MDYNINKKTKKQKVKSKEGALRKNGHKMTCGCHICDNIRNKEKNGGYKDEIIKENENKNSNKKKNGHRINCDCIICQNMKNYKKSIYSKKVRKNKKGRKNKTINLRRK